MAASSPRNGSFQREGWRESFCLKRSLQPHVTAEFHNLESGQCTNALDFALLEAAFSNEIDNETERLRYSSAARANVT